MASAVSKLLLHHKEVKKKKIHIATIGTAMLAMQFIWAKHKATVNERM